MTRSATLRWGIVGAADIARKNWKAIRNSGNGVVTMVASRSLEQAGQFVDSCQAQTAMPQKPQITDSYDKLINSSEVDAVYLPIPTGLRKEWVLKAAAAGKHVLCEKPCSSNLADLEEMVAACASNRVQFMDGVMFMHSARLSSIREAVEQRKNIGELRRITSAFSFCGDEGFFNSNIRMHSTLEPHGCLGDLGWYNIRFALWLMQETKPVEVRGLMLDSRKRPDSPADVPVAMSAEMRFPNGVSAGFYCSFTAGDQQWAHLSGTQGGIYVRDFVLPFYGHQARFEIQQAGLKKFGSDFLMEPSIQVESVNEYSNSMENAQESNLFRNFATLALNGKPDSIWPARSLLTQQVMEAILRSARDQGKPVLL